MLEKITLFVVIISFIIGFIISYKTNFIDKVIDSIGSMLLVTILYLIPQTMMLGLVDAFIDMPIESSECYQIAKLPNESDGIFVNCDQDNGSIKYTFYIKVENDYSVLKSCDKDITTIVNTDKKPYIKFVYNSLPKSSFWYNYTKVRLSKVFIYVPKGGVRVNYEQLTQ